VLFAAVLIVLSSATWAATFADQKAENEKIANLLHASVHPTSYLSAMALITPAKMPKRISDKS